ncbi:hypothetical protein QS071_005387, partial [Escherichia coli]
ISSDSAKIYKTGGKNNDENVLMVNTETGSVTLTNKKEISDAVTAFKNTTQYKELVKGLDANTVELMLLQEAANTYKYAINTPSLKLENIDKITGDEISKIDADLKKVKDIITSKTAPAYNIAIQNGMSVESALATAKNGDAALLNEFNRLGTNVNQLNKDTTFAIDADGNITLDETAGTGERYGVKDVVAEVVEDTTVRVAEDGSLTTARNTQTTKRVNEAVVDLDKSVRTNSQDIATNRKAIQSNSRQLQEHNA